MNTENLRNLNQFTGSEQMYRHRMSGILYTEGVQYLAENAECYWLIDAIASYQPQLLKQETFRYLQFWNLKVTGNRAVLTCRADSGIPPTVTQVIEWTDFPLPEIDLWVEHGTLILPSEH